MAFTPNDSSLLSNQDTNKFLMYAGIEPKISYSTIRDFTSWANWNLPYIINICIYFISYVKL